MADTLAYQQRELRRIVELRRAYEAERRRIRPYSTADENWRGIRERQIGVKLRWSVADFERIYDSCQQGEYFALGLFLDFLRTNPTVYGIMDTRTSMQRLPLQWSGDPALVRELKGVDPTYDKETGVMLDPGIEGDFLKLFPTREFRRVQSDGDLGGIGIGEFVPCGPIERLRHLPIHWLRYDYSLEKYVYQSPSATYEVNPGDGRWFVYTPYGRERPFAFAPWGAVALPAILGRDSWLDRARYMRDYADALKLVKLDKDRPPEDYDATHQFLEDGWRRSPHIVLRAGEDADLVESSGTGFKVFTEGEGSADAQIAKALSGGQKVTSEGTSGWSKGNIFDDIARGITENAADQLADAVHEQKLRGYAAARGRPPMIWVRWDVRSPDQKMADAKAIGEIAESVEKGDKVMAPRGKRVDLEAMSEQQGFILPTQPLRPEVPPPQLGAAVLRLVAPPAPEYDDPEIDVYHEEPEGSAA